MTGNSLTTDSFSSDTPVNNFATFNALDKNSYINLSNGNRTGYNSSSASFKHITIGVPFDAEDSDGYYMEIHADYLPGGYNLTLGAAEITATAERLGSLPNDNVR